MSISERANPVETSATKAEKVDNEPQTPEHGLRWDEALSVQRKQSWVRLFLCQVTKAMIVSSVSEQGGKHLSAP
jgi:hypothetical protein